MKYAIMHDFEDDGYYYESDSLHDCFEWAFANAKILYSDLHNKDVWCVCIYWDDFSKNYHICLEKDVRTVDDVCFRGSEQECDKFFSEHFVTEDNFESDDSIFPCDYE